MNGAGKPIVAVDIDGTLADYHGWFLKFAELWYGKTMPAPGDINPGQPLWKFMHVSRASYRECKLAYRQGGLKRSMPCLPGAAYLLNWIRRKPCLRNQFGAELCYRHGLGAEVWICTTRPYLRLDNVDPDTREWLRRNRIQYDALLFDPLGGDRKYLELQRQAGGRVACALEDLPEQVEESWKAGVPLTFLRDQPYNQHYTGLANLAPGGANRWSTAEQAGVLVSIAVQAWRANNAGS